MKLIILTLLLSFNSLAEIVVKVENTKGRKFKAKFESLEKANKWINSNAPKGDFGKNEKWVLSSEVQDLSVCLERRDIVPKEGDMYEECKLPKEYSILICDDEQIYQEGDPCKPITDDMKAKKQEKEDREAETRAIKKFNQLLEQADTPAKKSKLYERALKKLIRECL